jgi:hypothetical protein
VRTVSHYEVSAFRGVIREIPMPCALSTAPRKFSYGPGFSPWHPAPHRKFYSRADAQAVCDMLNERLTALNFPCAVPLGSDTAKQAAPASTPLDGERGVLPPSICTDGGSSDCYDHFAARFLTAHESY